MTQMVGSWEGLFGLPLWKCCLTGLNCNKRKHGNMRNGMFRVLGRSSAIYKLHMKTLEMSPSCRLFQFWFAVFELLNLLFSPIVGPTAFMNCREFPASMAPTGILCLEPWDERTSLQQDRGSSLG